MRNRRGPAAVDPDSFTRGPAASPESTMSLTRRLLATALNVGLMVLLFMVYAHPHAGTYGKADTFVYGRGDAPADVREEVVRRLSAFQDGYRKRDPKALETFSSSLLADEVTALGTMPREIYVGRKAVTELVRTDWDAWGDCTFFPHTAQVSARGDVAWFAMIGYVEFDLSRFLVLPLRVSGVLARAGTEWRFTQLQFQFDLDLTLLLVADLILIVWFVVNIALLLWVLIRMARRRTGLAAPAGKSHMAGV